MRAVLLPDYNANLIRAIKSLEIVDKDIPRPGEGQVLVKMAAAPCNPSDIAFMRGGYNIRKPVPTVPGFEGTGEVVSSGGGAKADSLLGKRVSCFSQGNEDGTWAEFAVTSADSCIELIEGMPVEQASALCVNPFTAFALYQFVLGKDAKAFIQNGASGQVGQFLRNLARKDGIRVINVVRKDEHVTELKEAGEEYVINMRDEDYPAQLIEMAGELGPTVAFDAVSGEIAGMMFKAMPAGSDLVVYGALSGEPVRSLDAMDIIFKEKIVRGFNLNDWKEAIGEEKYLEISQRIQELVLNGTLETRIKVAYRLSDAQNALMTYIRDMSGGKVLLEV